MVPGHPGGVHPAGRRHRPDRRPNLSRRSTP
jgi:hypothetical protein